MRWVPAGFALALALAMGQARAADLQVRVVDGAGHPLADAVVYAVPSIPVPHGKLPMAIIDQVHRQFVPRVSVVQAGTAIDFPNSDNIRHSVYSFSPAKTFELKLYAGRAAPPVTFDRAGIVVLGCEIHDTMVAWLLVVNTPYYGKSDSRGVATLHDLRAGDYDLQAWHEPMRQQSAGQPLRVAPGAVRLPDITVRLDANPTPGEAPPASAASAMAAMPGMSP